MWLPIVEVNLKRLRMENGAWLEIIVFFGVFDTKANGWKFGWQGSSQWANQYEISDEGSPLYGDDVDDYGNDGDSNDDIFDEEGPVVCNGLDHADSQGLNKTNLRLRYRGTI